MHITDETPKSEITIQGATFNSPEPYSAGHTLTENEANALNQLLAENLRNNFAGTVKAALEKVEGKVADLDLIELQSQFDAYAKEYEFGARRTGTRVPKDPIAHEAWKIATKIVNKALKKQNLDKAQLEEGKFESFVESLSKRADIVAAAKQAVEALQSLQEITLEG